jgi:hypothetical protein
MAMLRLVDDDYGWVTTQLKTIADRHAKAGSSRCWKAATRYRRSGAARCSTCACSPGVNA